MMTITNEITKLQTNLLNCYTVCNNKGATMPASQNFDSLAMTIDSIRTGDFYAELTVVTNEGATVTVNEESQIAYDGTATFNIYLIGNYTVTCEIEGHSKSGFVYINEATTYRIALFPKSNVPDEYQELEYIQANGTGYIDTGFAFTSNYAKVSLEIMFTAQDTGGKNLFGSSTNYDSSWFGIYMQGPTQAGFYCGDSNPWNYIFDRNEKISLSFDRQGYTLDIDNNGIINTYSVGGTIVCGNNLLIASQPPLGSQRTPVGVRYYNFTVEQDSSIVRQFVPCYRKVDTVAGMYDIKNGAFYPPEIGTFDMGSII